MNESSVVKESSSITEKKSSSLILFLQNQKRIWFPPVKSFDVVWQAALIGTIFGGLRKSRLRLLQYTAENAHKKPKSKKDWYLYHRQKQFTTIIYGGKMGAKEGLKIALLLTSFITFDWNLQRYSLNKHLEEKQKNESKNLFQQQMNIQNHERFIDDGLGWFRGTISATVIASILSFTRKTTRSRLNMK